MLFAFAFLEEYLERDLMSLAEIQIINKGIPRTDNNVKTRSIR